MLQTVFPHVVHRPAQLTEVISHLPSPVRNAFRRMGVAEEEIEQAKRRHPARSEEVHRGFGILLPSPVLDDVSEGVYRRHCAELLDRVASGDNTELGTDAECLAAILRAALRAPLAREGMAVAHHLSLKVLPDLGEDPITESWPGQVAEDLAAMRKRLAVKGRRIEPKVQL